MPGAQVFAYRGLQRLADAIAKIEPNIQQVTNDGERGDTLHAQSRDHHPVEQQGDQADGQLICELGKAVIGRPEQAIPAISDGHQFQAAARTEPMSEQHKKDARFGDCRCRCRPFDTPFPVNNEQPVQGDIDHAV